MYWYCHRNIPNDGINSPKLNPTSTLTNPTLKTPNILQMDRNHGIYDRGKKSYIFIIGLNDGKIEYLMIKKNRIKLVKNCNTFERIIMELYKWGKW